MSSSATAAPVAFLRAVTNGEALVIASALVAYAIIMSYQTPREENWSHTRSAVCGVAVLCCVSIMAEEHLLPPEAMPYFGLFVVLAIIAGVLFIRNASTDTVETTPAFKAFQRDYLIVYWIMQFADWMQGPYIYALYSERKFSQGTIGILFVAGFGSALVLGTVVGALADRTGRRLNCLAFAVIYATSCILTHSESFELLLVGRILGGISGSILNTAFESWMVSEHNSRGFAGAWLGQTFSLAVFGSGVAAIAAGLVATPLVSIFGVNAPFDVSAVCLAIGGLVILSRWNENYGETSEGTAAGGVGESFARAWAVLRSNSMVAMVGITQTLFEAAMYIFVFFWTPTLEASLAAYERAGNMHIEHGVVDSSGGSNLPHGLVFACYMVSVMIGSKLFESVARSHAAETWGFIIFAVASASLLVPVVVSNHWIQLFSLCTFELCCGCYFPLISVLRSKYIPEEVRSTLMNMFRIGLNIIVLTVLGHAESFGEAQSFLLCSALLGGAVLPQLNLREGFTAPVAGVTDDGSSGKGSKGTARKASADGDDDDSSLRSERG